MNLKKKIEILCTQFVHHKSYIMVSSSSKTSNNNDWQMAKQKAIKTYNYRLKNYNPFQHGPMEYYLAQIEAEYELECIPEYLRGRIRNEW